jgi:hypothetical protein
MFYVTPADLHKVLDKNGITVNDNSFSEIYDKLDLYSIEEETDNLKYSLIEKQLFNLKIKVRSMSIKVVVGCHSSEGAEVHVVEVDCSQDQYEKGMHYDAAKGYVEENYEVKGPYWMVDEKDSVTNLFRDSIWNKYDHTFVD